MGFHKVYKNRDIRFNCANYDFRSGHCKAYAIFNNLGYKEDEDGKMQPEDVYCYPIGCSGDPKCKMFKEKQHGTK